MSSDYNGYLSEVKQVAVKALKHSKCPTDLTINIMAKDHVRKRVQDRIDAGANPIAEHVQERLVDNFTRSARAMIDLWHVAKGSGTWPPEQPDC